MSAPPAGPFLLNDCHWSSVERPCPSVPDQRNGTRGRVDDNGKGRPFFVALLIAYKCMTTGNEQTEAMPVSGTTEALSSTPIAPAPPADPQMSDGRKIGTWPDDQLLVSAIHQFLVLFRSVASYSDIVEMPHAAFEQLEATEKGRIFEAALARYIVRTTGRRFQLITGAGSLDFGLGLGTPSGIRHELDAVLSNGATLYAFEAKHFLTEEVTKDMLAIFNQKTLDFYLELLRRGLPISMKRLFVARTENYKFKVREFAWSWGVSLLGGNQPDPIWLHAQLRRWLDTRVVSPALLEQTRFAEALAAHSMRDLADIIQPFSAAEASIRLDRLLDAERCEEFCRVHEEVARFWWDQRRPLAF